MVIRWQNEWKPELKAEGPSRCTIELEPVGSAVKLTLTHDGLPFAAKAERMRFESETHPKIPPWALIIRSPTS